jgi:hypothetical protein
MLIDHNYDASRIWNCDEKPMHMLVIMVAHLSSRMDSN